MSLNFNGINIGGSDSGGGSQITIDSALSISSTNPVQNKVITGTFIDNIDIVNTTTYTDLTTETLDGYGWTPPSNGWLIFRNEGSGNVKCGVIIANAYVGTYLSLPPEGIISQYMAKGRPLWVVRGSLNVLVRFYPVKSGL